MLAGGSAERDAADLGSKPRFVEERGVKVVEAVKGQSFPVLPLRDIVGVPAHDRAAVCRPREISAGRSRT